MLNPVSGRSQGVSSSTPQVVGGYLLNGWSYAYNVEIFWLFTKLGKCLENFKSITLSEAAPGHRKLEGPIREASHLGDDHDADVLWL